MPEIDFLEGDGAGTLISRTIKVQKRATRRWPLQRSVIYSHVLDTPLGHVRPCVVMQVDTPDETLWLLATLTVPGVRPVVLRVDEEAAVRWLILNGDKVPRDVSARVTIDPPLVVPPEAAQPCAPEGAEPNEHGELSQRIGFPSKGMAGLLQETIELIPRSPLAPKLIKYLCDKSKRKATVREICKYLYNAMDKASLAKTRRLIDRTRETLIRCDAPLRIERDKKTEFVQLFER